MNYRVPICMLHLSKFGSNGVYRNWYCSALKPQLQSVNCVDIMTRSELCRTDVNNRINLIKRHQDLALVSASKILNKLYNEEFTLLKFTKMLRAIRLQLEPDATFILKHDPRFIELCELFESNCQKSSPFLLISALRSLLSLNVDPETKIVETIGKTVLEKIDKFDGNDMLECLLLFHNNTSITDTQKEIVKILLQEIPKNLHHLTSGSSVFKLMKVYDQFDKKMSKKLDLTMAELVRNFSTHYLCKLLCLLAEKESRNKTLLRAISHTLQNSEDKPNLKQTVDMLYALNSLNYPDSSLILYLTDDRAPEIFVTDQPSLISSLLTACGHLRWRHTEIMEACSQWVMNNTDKCSSREFVAYILTAATLNYTPSIVVLRHLLPCLQKEKINSSTVWLDVVWSLAILGHIDKEMLLGIFNKDFYEPLLDGADYRVMSSKLKLMNLKSVLKNKHPECIFSCDLFLDSVEVPKSSEVESSKRSVIDALSNFIPPEKYMYTNQCTDMGISIDAELIIDGKGKPLPLLEYGSKIKSTMLTKTLPPDSRRVAVLVLTHKDFTLNEHHVTGVISLTTELLKSQGYVVIQIPFSEFSENLTTVKKAHYLQKKIISAIEFSSTDKKM